MTNEIYVDDVLIQNEFPKKQFKNGYLIRCVKCDELIYRKWFDNSILNEKYICKKCVMLHDNPMFNDNIKQKHSDIMQSYEYKKKLSDACTGTLNGFYGKKHTPESIEKIIKSFRNWYLKLSEDDYNNWRKKMSDGNKKLMIREPFFYSEIKRKAAIASHVSQFSKKGMNKIEKIVYNYIVNKGLNIKFSVILGKHQYDFGIKDKRILIEIDGDYWHSNPKLFNKDGTDGKRKINKTQLSKTEKDIIKTNFALKHNFKLIRIWEDEVKNGTFVNKLNDIL